YDILDKNVGPNFERYITGEVCDFAGLFFGSQYLENGATRGCHLNFFLFSFRQIAFIKIITIFAASDTTQTLKKSWQSMEKKKKSRIDGDHYSFLIYYS
ncbi:hypothetical protein ACJX0J_033856, partial [Zea mays]